MADEIVATGRVLRRPFAVGSKSERSAVVLECDGGGRQLVLRRAGGNAFHDPELEELVGRSIRCRGIVHGYTLLMTSYEIVPG